MKLVAFDGDDTLWVPLGGLFLSDRTPDDRHGAHFSFHAVPGRARVIGRDDGVRFALRADAADVLRKLRDRGVLTALVSFNHMANVTAALAAFGVSSLFDYVVAEWHRDKGQMLTHLLAAARADGHHLDFSDLLLVDDDYYGLYAGQCERIGARFLCFGRDIQALSELL